MESKTTACFTGHRSQKLPWRFNEEDERCPVMRATLVVEIEKAIRNGYKTFLCGMALGFDMICAETGLDLKKKYNDIKIIGVLPCKTQDIKWSVKDRKRYRKLLNGLDGIRCIYDEYIGGGVYDRKKLEPEDLPYPPKNHHNGVYPKVKQNKKVFNSSAAEFGAVYVLDHVLQLNS